MRKTNSSKQKGFLTFSMLLAFSITTFATNYYVATNGNDSNSGTSTSSPFKTLQKAVAVVSAGDCIYIMDGKHSMTTSPVVITKNGTSGSNIRVFAYSGSPVLSFDDNENSSSKGIVMDGDYWHWKGITIEKAGDNGMLLSGNNNTIENCVFRKNHDTGLQLSRYNSNADQLSEWPSNNLIVGCEAYDNIDSDNEDADGFAAKLTCGTGNVFRSCVSHHNIDDGWDLYTKSETGPIGAVLFEDCIAHHNGILTDGNTSGGGDKNGFKLGSSSNKVNHELRRCIAYKNGKHGFTDNGNIGNIKFYNLTSYDNGDYNYHTRNNASHTFRNCITLDGNHTDKIVGDAPTSCNAFDDTDTDWLIEVSTSDFQTMTPGPNNDPTSNGFLNLKSSSSLIDAGCSASGVFGNGTLDLGAIEYGGTVDPTTYTLSTSTSGSGSISGAGTYNSGTTVSVLANPASGWSFSNWSGDVSGSSNPISISMNSNKSVTAVFVEGDTDPVGDIIHNFTTSGTSSNFFDISGNLSTSKGTVVYAGLTLTQCLKIESSTSISFTTSQEGELTLVFNHNFSGGIKIDGTSKDASSGILSTNLSAGSHTITKDEVANLYYISITNNGTNPVVTYALTTTINGEGSVNPSSGIYKDGTSVSMTAIPASGWQFDSWSGGSTCNPATVVMDADKNITANFTYAGGNEGADFALAGWATQGSGTTGGTGGTIVYASTGDQILDYIDEQKDNMYPNGLVIMVNGTITPGNTSETKIDIKDCRNISIIGAGSGAEFNGIGIKVYKAGNIIIRNVKVHHVLIGDKDCISIEGPADHIWVDHCELYNEYDGVGKDYYDALLDAKRDAEYITYSWNYLHDSWKTSLVGSSETDTYDRKITMHHNYYRNCSSRLPLFRGGNGHVFNNYYKDIHSTGINSRLGACVRIEGNYFEDVLNPYVSAYSDELGSGELIDNTLDNCTFEYSDDTHELPSCNAYVPYIYSGVLNSSSVIKSLVPANAGIGKLSNPGSFSVKCAEESLALNNEQVMDAIIAYPNPFSGTTQISFNLSVDQDLTMNLYDFTGRLVDNVTAQTYGAGTNAISYENTSLTPGMYILSIRSGNAVKNIQLIIK